MMQQILPLVFVGCICHHADAEGEQRSKKYFFHWFGKLFSIVVQSYKISNTNTLNI